MRGFSNWCIVVAVSLLLVAVPLGWWPRDPYGFIKWVMVGVAAAACGAVWLATSLERGGVELRRNALNLPLLLFVAWSSLSLLAGPPWFYVSRRLSEVLFLAVLYLILTVAIGERRRRAFLLVSSLVGLTAISVLGIAHYSGFFATLVSPWGSGLGRRAYATMLNPNYLSAYLISLLPLALAFFVFGRRGKWTLLFLAIVLLCSSVCLLFTVSWGGWCGWLVSVVLLVLLALRRGRTYLRARRLVAVLVVSALLAGVFLYVNRNTVAGDASGMKFRLLYWRAAAVMIRERPVIGWGLNAFWPNITAYLTDIIASDYRDGVPRVGPAETVYEGVYAHNEYLGIWLELGIVGLIFFVWLICRFFYQGMRNLRAEGSATETAVNIGALCGVAAMLAQSVVSYPLRIPATTVSCALLLALVGAGRGTTRRFVRVPLPRPVRIALALAVLGCAAALIPRLVRPLTGETLYVGARRASFQGDWTTVSGRCREALAYPLTEPEVYDLVADAHERLGEYTEALEALHAKLELKPHDVNAYLRLGKLYRRLGRDDRAAWCFERAVRLERHDSPEGRVYLASILAEQGRGEEAVELLEGGLDRYGRHWMLRNSLGIAYAERGERNPAAREFLSGRACGGSASPLYNLRILERSGTGVAAVGFIGPAEHDWIRERIENGRAALRRGEGERARGEFQAVLERYPDYVPALSNMGTYCMKTQRMDEALALWKRATVLDPDHRIDPL